MKTLSCFMLTLIIIFSSCTTSEDATVKNTTDKNTPVKIKTVKNSSGYKITNKPVILSSGDRHKNKYETYCNGELAFAFFKKDNIVYLGRVNYYNNEKAYIVSGAYLTDLDDDTKPSELYGYSYKIDIDNILPEKIAKEKVDTMLNKEGFIRLNGGYISKTHYAQYLENQKHKSVSIQPEKKREEDKVAAQIQVSSQIWQKQYRKDNWGDIIGYTYDQLVVASGRGSSGQGTWSLMIKFDPADNSVSFGILPRNEGDLTLFLLIRPTEVTISLRSGNVTHSFKGVAQGGLFRPIAIISVSGKNGVLSSVFSENTDVKTDPLLVEALKKNTDYTILIEGNADRNDWYVRANIKGYLVVE
jgi:hypothetical protein